MMLSHSTFLSFSIVSILVVLMICDDSIEVKLIPWAFGSIIDGLHSVGLGKIAYLQWHSFSDHWVETMTFMAVRDLPLNSNRFLCLSTFS